MSNYNHAGNPPLRAVHVVSTDHGDEYYEVGQRDVTAVEWHEQSGHMASIPTVRVFKNGILHSEHPFHTLHGVYYAEAHPMNMRLASEILLKNSLPCEARKATP